MTERRSKWEKMLLASRLVWLRQGANLKISLPTVDRFKITCKKSKIARIINLKRWTSRSVIGRISLDKCYSIMRNCSLKRLQTCRNIPSKLSHHKTSTQWVITQTTLRNYFRANDSRLTMVSKTRMWLLNKIVSICKFSIFQCVKTNMELAPLQKCLIQFQKTTLKLVTWHYSKRLVPTAQCPQLQK